MGLDNRRPPLPAPTDFSSLDDDESEVATNLTTKTSHTIPEDGSPITISTHRGPVSKKEGRHHHRQKSQTSLLIEYFEAGKGSHKSKNKPSVRVRVTPSSRKGSRGQDAVQITGIGKDRKPSYSRRISLTSRRQEEERKLEGTEISHSSESNISGRPPMEVKVLNDHSDLSSVRSPLLYAANESNVSSMPPDSMIEGSTADSDTAREYGPEGSVTASEAEYLKAPAHSRSRSASQDRITQKVMEKINQQASASGKTRRSSRDYDDSGHRRRRSSKLEDDVISGVESSLLSSNPTASQHSRGSSLSQGSRMTNNPRLLEMVEDTIKRMILPEINAIKEDQKVDRNHRTFEESRRGSIPHNDLDTSSVGRSLSKSSSTPHFTNRPKVVLNRDGDDPGTVLSRGDSEHKKRRKSSKDRPSTSRKSSGRLSIEGESYLDEDGNKVKSSKTSHRTRDAAAGAIAGGILTHAALQHHDSQGDVHERRKKRTKSKGAHERSASFTDTADESSYLKEKIVPPMPMASRINDSDVTRDSLVSTDSRGPGDSTLIEEVHTVRTPVRETSRGSFGTSMSPTSSRTPTRNSVSRGLGMSHDNTNLGSPDSNASTTKARIAALTAAGLGGAAVGRGLGNRQHVDTDGYGKKTSRPSLSSPAQSVSSLRNKYEEPLIPSPLRPTSAASRPSSVSRLRDSQESPTSMRSPSPTGKHMRPRKNIRAMDSSGDEFTTPLERPNPAYMRDGASTPTSESVDEWYERQHLENDKYRDSLDATTNRTSYQTNPYPEDENRYSAYTEDSQADDKRFSTFTQDSLADSNRLSVAQDVRGMGANPHYVNHPAGLESAVASLVDPSTMSSGMMGSSTTDSLAKGHGTYSDRMAQHTRNMSQDNPTSYDGSSLSQTGPSQDRWAALKGQAANHLASNSPDQLGAIDLHQDRPQSGDSVKLGASGLPDMNDPLPEIGHFDDTKSELSTNPSFIQGPLGGDRSGKETWPYTPSPSQEVHSQARPGSSSSKGGSGKAIALGAGVTAAAAIAMAKSAQSAQAAHSARQPHIEVNQYDDHRLTPDTRRYGEEDEETDGKLTPDVGRYHGEDIDRNATPTSPAMLRDEGYDTAHDRSAGALTPKGDQPRYGSADIDAFNKAMNGPGGGDDPFMSDPRHQRHVSGGSHGMASPLYDASTGKGMDNIQSKDIVALMDHLTVRDAQRNARDTEILVSLVRSATEMRQNFEEMKHFIKDQDRMIMANTDRDAEQTVQRVLGGPRPQPLGSPRTPRQSQTSSEDVQTKRKGVLSRALRGLKGNKNASASDLARIEEMLMQVLDNVEDLKHQGVIPARQPMSSYTNETSDSLDSYEKLRAAPDSGYEPEGNAGTGSTPSHSGHLSITPRGDKNQFHSGYNGRPGSVNRVSTVMEGDEDERSERYYDDDQDSYLEPHERDVLQNQFENNEKLLSPVQEMRRGFTPTHTPPQRGTPGSQGNDLTPRTADKERKHKSNSSSIFAGIPKISRWSKTTSSSAAADPTSVDSPNMARNQRPISRSSQASSLQSYDSEDFLPRDDYDDRSSFASTRDGGHRPNPNAETRSMRSQGSRLTRTPSPLIPSEASYNRDDDDYSYNQQQPRHIPQQQPVQHSPVQQLADFGEPEFDDPKYQAHRNSLLLQHPQPRQGPTSRHQNTLEDQAFAQIIDDGATSSSLSQQTVSDFDPANWGSAGAGSLNRNRLPATDPTNSPVSSKAKPDLSQSQQRKPVPAQQQQAPSKESYDRYDDDEEDEDWEPKYSNSGFARNYNSHSGGGGAGMYYSSPLGSGHLLEPIQEVRYSLETDSGHISPEPSMTPKLSSARVVDVRGGRRGNSLTGPRPMGAKSPGPSPIQQQQQQAAAANGTVRRKPVRGSKASQESFQSETF